MPPDRQAGLGVSGSGIRGDF